jgi:putative oxidoreductase
MATVESGRTRAVDTGIAILRVVVGIVFVAHGAQKVFQFGFAGVTQGFAQMNIPLPAITGPGVALLELIGGAMLIVGLLTRPVALLLMIDMIGAIVLVHLRSGFFLPQGYEFALTLGAASLALALTGAGAFSLDGVIAGRRSPRLATADRA